jgi:hypothetical protein
MNKRLAGAMAFAVCLWGAAITRRDFRAGRSRFWLSGGINMFEASREQDPAWFWAFTAINAVLIAGLLAVSALLVIVP